MVLAEQRTSTHRSGKPSRPLRCVYSSSGQVRVSGTVAAAAFATHACCSLILLSHRADICQTCPTPLQAEASGTAAQATCGPAEEEGQGKKLHKLRRVHVDMFVHEFSCSHIKPVKCTLSLPAVCFGRVEVDKQAGP